MPRITIELPLSREPLYESVATFLAVQAHPELDETTDYFRTAACRALIPRSVKRDELWIPQAIKPGYFLMSDERLKQELQSGQKRLLDRKAAAMAIHPLFDQVFEHKDIDVLRGLGTTQPNTAEGRLIMAGAWLESGDAGVKNFQSRKVKPSRPVIHLAYAFWRAVLELRRQGVQPEERAQERILTDRDMFKAVVRFSETCRLIAPTIPELGVSEGDLIALRLDC
jgi:hypothetical protein